MNPCHDRLTKSAGVASKPLVRRPRQTPLPHGRYSAGLASESLDFESLVGPQNISVSESDNVNRAGLRFDECFTDEKASQCRVSAEFLQGGKTRTATPYAARGPTADPTLTR